MAATPLHPSSLVVVESAMGFAPPRLMLAPSCSRLPPGVHEVAPVVVAVSGRVPRGARAVVAAAAGDGIGFPSPTPRGTSFSGISTRGAGGDGTCVVGSMASPGRSITRTTTTTGAPTAAGLGGPGSTSRSRHGTSAGAGTMTSDTRSALMAETGFGGRGFMTGDGIMFGSLATATGHARSVVAFAAAGAGFGGAGPTARLTRSALGGAAWTGASSFAVASPSVGSSRGPRSSCVSRALDLGDDGGGEEDPSDDLSYQQAQRQMQAAVYLVCLKRRVEVAADLGLFPSGRECRILLEELGDIDPAVPIYHWVITRLHDRFRATLGAEVYQQVIAVTPKEDSEFKWIVQADSEIIVSTTTLMAEIKYSIMHNETWRAVVRDHPLFDVCPLFLNKFAESVAEFSTNLDLACFKRPFPPIIQRMAENHALAVVHLYESLLDFYEVLAGEEAEDPKKTKELRMRFDFLFVQDLDPLDYMCGAGAADTKELLSLLKMLKPEVRAFRGAWM